MFQDSNGRDLGDLITCLRLGCQPKDCPPMRERPSWTDKLSPGTSGCCGEQSVTEENFQRSQTEMEW